MKGQLYYVRPDGSTIPLEQATRDFHASADENARLRVENADLRDRLADARFAPMGDNHHNAFACPYCNPDQIRPEDVAALRKERAHLLNYVERIRAALAYSVVFEDCSGLKATIEEILDQMGAFLTAPAGGAP